MKKSLIFLLFTMIGSAYGADLAVTPISASGSVGPSESTEFPDSWTGACFSPGIVPTTHDVKQAENNNELGTDSLQDKSIEIAGHLVTGKNVLQIAQDALSVIIPRLAVAAVDSTFPNREQLGQVPVTEKSEDVVSSACFRPENLPTQADVDRAVLKGQIGANCVLDKHIELSDGTILPISEVAKQAVFLAGAYQNPVVGVFVQACLGNKASKRIWSK